MILLLVYYPTKDPREGKACKYGETESQKLKLLNAEKSQTSSDLNPRQHAV